MIKDICKRYRIIQNQIIQYEEFLDELSKCDSIDIKVTKSSFNSAIPFYEDLCMKLKISLQKDIIVKRIEELQKELEKISKYEQLFNQILEEDQWKEFANLLKL